MVQVVFADDAVLDMRQDAGVIPGVKFPVEKPQHDGVGGTPIHDVTPQDGGASTS